MKVRERERERVRTEKNREVEGKCSLVVGFSPFKINKRKSVTTDVFK